MSAIEINPAPAGSRLKSELARYCLPETGRDPGRKLAWVNSICVLFLLIGLVGARSASVSLQAPPPLEVAAPVIILTPPPPPPTTVEPTRETEPKQDDSTPQRVVVATLITPAVNFSIPTIANLVVPNGVAVAPPANPMQPVVPVQSRPTLISSDQSGDRPPPTFPPFAERDHKKGTVRMRFSVDPKGSITNIVIIESSGDPVFKQHTIDFLKSHWRVPPTPDGNPYYETTINYID